MEISAQQYISNEKDPKSYVVSHVNLFSTRDQKSSKEGDIYVVLKMSSEKELPLHRLSKFVLDSITDGYLYSHEKTTNDSMKSALADGFNKLRSLIQSDREVAGSKIDLTMLVCLVKKEGLYIGSIGNGEIYVVKGEKVVDIADIMKKKDANTAGVVLEENEALLLSTEGIFSENLAGITVASEEGKLEREVTRIGVNMTGNNAAMSFINTKKPLVKEHIEEMTESTPTIAPTFVPPEDKKKLVLDLKKINIGKVIVKDTTEKIGSTFKETKGKIGGFLEKVKPSEATREKIRAVWSKIKGVFKKIWEYIKSVFVAIWDKISSLLSRKRWFKKIMSKYSEINLKRPRQTVQTVGMRVDDYKVRDLRGRRIKLVLGIITIIVLIILGVNFSMKTKEANELSKDANQKFTQIQRLLDKTEQNIDSDKSSAETAYFDAGNLLKEIPEGLKEKDTTKAKELEGRYEKLGDQLFKKVGFSSELGNLSSYLSPSLSAIGEGAELVDIDKYIDKNNVEYLLITDKGKKAVYRIPLAETPVVEVIKDEQKILKAPMYVAVGERGVFVYDKDTGVVKAQRNEDDSLGSFITLPGLLARDITGIDVVDMIVLTANDNVYLLSPDQKAILRSTAVYGDRYSMLNKYVENPAFENATDIHGDFSVYVFTKGEEGILRYIWSSVEQKQVLSEFGIIGLSGGVGKITKGYTYADSMDSGLYMFDSEGKRFLRFEKPQEGGADIRHPNQLLLLKQYEYRGGDKNEFKNVKDFVVDHKEENMYVLDGNTVWKIAL
ncbi:MAG TPA: hypothetical protein PLG10_03160 [Candidatus Dojkabacteria bacterium]|nr:hypothetical protein [Candidatus Dojkabacteria bacterium]